MILQTNVMNYGGNGKVVSVLSSASKPAADATQANGKADCGCGCKSECNGQAKKSAGGAESVDFTKMTAAQKVAFHKARWDRILG